MPRWKDGDINLPGLNADGSRSWESISVGLLMDIRDELKELNGRARDASYQRVTPATNARSSDPR